MQSVVGSFSAWLRNAETALASRVGWELGCSAQSSFESVEHFRLWEALFVAVAPQFPFGGIPCRPGVALVSLRLRRGRRKAFEMFEPIDKSYQDLLERVKVRAPHFALAVKAASAVPYATGNLDVSMNEFGRVVLAFLLWRLHIEHRFDLRTQPLGITETGRIDWTEAARIRVISGVVTSGLHLALPITLLAWMRVVDDEARSGRVRLEQRFPPAYDDIAMKIGVVEGRRIARIVFWESQVRRLALDAHIILNSVEYWPRKQHIHRSRSGTKRGSQ